MTTEIPIWVNSTIRWVSGVDKKTTCKDVIEVILRSDKNKDFDPKDFTIMERWRRVERPLDENSRILKVWSHWGDEKKEVRLCLRRIDNEVDSGRGSPIGVGNTPSLRRKRHRSRGTGKPPWSYHETVHPRRLAKLGLDNEELLQQQSELLHNRSSKKQDVENKRKAYKSYQCLGTGMLHSTLLSQEEECNHPKATTSKCCSKRTSKQKVRNSENIEKLMKLILAQGATIQSQLQKLKEREEQIETMEHERHRERIEKNGRNYLLETYLGSLSEAEVPKMDEVDEEKGNDSGVHTEGGSDQVHWEKEKKETDISKETGMRIPRRSSFNNLGRTEHEKSKRSRSENRVETTPQDKRTEGNLKRTKSENTLNENKKENTKENSEELVELTRIQSQVQLWEKVFKINKKLEKEEENLVRLHIKIKRVQSENLKLAKEREETEAKSTAEDSSEVECKTTQINLEAVRSDLDQNSKEIYHNFTKLLEEDEVVEQKKNYLTKLVSDLERTEHEHCMLNEMVAMSQQNVPETEDIGLTLMVKGQEKVDQDESLQKPKSVKISFDDQVQESNERTKEPPNVAGAIKGILKNRNQTPDKLMERYEKVSDGYGSNINVRTEKVDEKDLTIPGVCKGSTSETPLARYDMYSYPGHTPYRNPVYAQTQKREFPDRTLVTTKAVIHNDTDSSTSSDTSGLCSMYSSSPTVEEPYHESGYVLDTLV